MFMSLVRNTRRYNRTSSNFNINRSHSSTNKYTNSKRGYSTSNTIKSSNSKTPISNSSTSSTNNFKVLPTSGKSEPKEPLRDLHFDAIKERRAKDNVTQTNVPSGGILSSLSNMFSGFFSSPAKETPQPTKDDLNKEERFNQFEDKHLPALAQRYKNNEFYFRDVAADVAHKTPLAAAHRNKSPEEIEALHDLPKQISSKEAEQHAYGGEMHPEMISLSKSVPVDSHYGGEDKLTQVINRQGLETAEGDKALSEVMARHIIPRSKVEGVLTPEQTRKLRDLVRNPENEKALEALKKRYGMTW